MNCEQARERMAVIISGERDAALDQHLQGCAECRKQAGIIEDTWSRLAALPDYEPGAHVRARFHDMLGAYQEGVRARAARPLWKSWFSPILQFGVAAACLLIGVVLGKSGTSPSADVSELRKEMNTMRQMVTLSLLQQQSAAERLRGVTWSYRTEPSDMEVLAALLRTINTDPSDNVRLAAVDAIRNFADSPVARRGLIQALAKQTSPLMQIALVDTMTDLKIAEMEPPLRQMLESPELDPSVRHRIQLALTR